MLKRLHVQNFRGFRDLTVDLAPIVVVAGPNSSGKTSLLHAIRIALVAVEVALRDGGLLRLGEGDAGWAYFAGDLLVTDHTVFLPVRDWASLFTDRAVGENVAFSIGLEFSDEERVREVHALFRCARNNQLKLVVSVRVPEAAARARAIPAKSARRNEVLREEIAAHVARAVLVPAFYGVVKDEDFQARVMVDRQLGAGDQSHIVRSLVTRLEPEGYTRIRSFLRETIRADLVSRPSLDEADRTYPLKVEFTDTNGALELSSAGAGLVNLVALNAALEWYRAEQRDRPVLFLLDEPEAHLHPRLQATTANHVASRVAEFGAQVLMATHSVEIINAIGLREDAVLLRVDRATSSATVLRGQDQIVGDLATWADLTPFSTINFLASRRILFHEGPSDRDILEHCAKVRYRTDDRRYEAFRRWTFARLEGSGNRGVAGMLLRLIRTEVIPTLGEGEPVQVVTVLDKDHGREPGMRPGTTTGAVRDTEVVWSVHSIESLFVQPAVLLVWLRAWFHGVLPEGIDVVVEQAVAAADEDAGLRDEAILALQKQILKAEPGRSDEQITRASRTARETVDAAPAIWQRGHDRSRFVLGRIREAVPHEVRRNLPTDLASFVTRCDPDQFGDREAAIPEDVRRLLDLMVRPRAVPPPAVAGAAAEG